MMTTISDAVTGGRRSGLPTAPTTRPLHITVAAPAFGKRSETFIKKHVALLGSEAGSFISFGPLPDTAAPSLRVDPPSLPFLGWAGRLPNGAGRRLLPAWTTACRARDRARLSTFLHDRQSDVVLAEYGGMGLFLWESCHSAAVPLVVHFHGADATVLPRNRRYAAKILAMFGHASAVIAPSAYIAGRLRGYGCPAHLLEVLPCSVDTDAFRAAEGDGATLTCVGRLVPKKAPHLVIRAFAPVAADFPAAHLHVVGDGPLRRTCENEIRSLGLGSRVTMHGALDHEGVRRILSRTDVFLQHSVTAPNGDMEGLPVGVLEAMSSALPVIATLHSGIPEAVIDGETGFLVPEHDVAGMAARLAALLSDPALAQAMGAAGRARVIERFDDRVAGRVLREIVGRAAAGLRAAPRM